MCGRIAILLALCCSTGCAEKIPLDQIWALRMPGTVNVRELEPKHFDRSLPEEEQIERMEQSLSFQIEQAIKSQVGQGFVVSGTGKEALGNVLEVLRTDKRPQAVPAKDEVTIFFYSREFGSYVHLKDASLSGNTITLTYQFVGHAAKTTEANFALVPLGKLPAGEFKVEIVQRPVLTDLTDVVCEPFRFRVE